MVLDALTLPRAAQINTSVSKIIVAPYKDIDVLLDSLPHLIRTINDFFVVILYFPENHGTYISSEQMYASLHPQQAGLRQIFRSGPTPGELPTF